MVHGEVRSLTGIRAIAVLGILIAGASVPLTALGAYDVPVLGTFLRSGSLGFDLMFVLSGLILTRNHFWLGSDLTAGGALRLWAIRLARFYPVYLLVVIGAVAWNLLGGWGDRLSGLEIARAVLLVQAWTDVPSALAVTWSISVIWFAYLVFPVLCLLLFWLRKRSYALFGIWIVAMAAVMILCRDTSTSGWPAIVRGVGEFVVGAVTYCLVTALSSRGSARRWTRASRAVGALMVLVLIVGVLTVPQPIFLLPAVVILLGALLRSRQGVSSVFASTPLHALGVIAFSAYMVSGLWSHACEWAAEQWGISGSLTWAVVAVMIIGAAVIGAVVWRLIESPLRNALTSRLRGGVDEPSELAAEHALEFGAAGQ